MTAIAVEVAVSTAREAAIFIAPLQASPEGVRRIGKSVLGIALPDAPDLTVKVPPHVADLVMERGRVLVVEVEGRPIREHWVSRLEEESSQSD